MDMLKYNHLCPRSSIGLEQPRPKGQVGGSIPLGDASCMNKRDIIKFLIFRTLGNFLLLFSIFGIAMTFGEALYQEARYRVNLAMGVEFVVFHSPSEEAKESDFGALLQREEQETSGFAPLLNSPSVKPLIAKDTDFSILIPKIGASSKVIANVDAGNEKEYLRVLQEGVAHAAGTVFPGMKGNIYLFAHSADNFWNVGRYNGIFYLVKELEPGDSIVVVFQGKRHDYIVSEKRIVDGDDVDYLLSTQGGGEEMLTLQTCWPPGTVWKRLLVFAKPKTN